MPFRDDPVSATISDLRSVFGCDFTAEDAFFGEGKGRRLTFGQTSAPSEIGGHNRLIHVS